MKSKLKNRALAMMLALILILGMATPLASAADFGDTSGHWAEAVIDKWAGLGILQGDDRGFRPDDPISRGEFAVVVDRIARYQTVSTKTFVDLDPTDPTAFYADAMLKLHAVGVINGVGDDKIDPTGTLPREQAIAILARMFDVAPDASGLAAFSDANAVEAWAKAEVGGMALAGYVQGDDGKLDPKGNLTRAQAMQMFENIIKGFYNTAGTYSDNIEGIVVVNAPGVVLKDMGITGNLFVTPGVGSGDCTLTNVLVAGDVHVMGGGSNSFIVNGGTTISGTMIINKSGDGAIRVVFEDGTEVPVVFIDDGSNDVIITGAVESLVVGEGVTVNAVNATIENVTLEGDGAKLDVDASSTVKDVTVDASGTTIEGAGKVETVTVESGEDNKVTTPKTTVDNKSDAPVAIDDKGGKIDGGASGEVPVDTTPAPVNPGPAPVTSITVDSVEALKAALTNSQYSTINIGATIGNSTTYTTYEVTRPVTIQGSGTVYGSFVVIAEGVTFSGITIHNKGDATGYNTAERNAINYLGNNITIQGCTFQMGAPSSGIANGVSIFTKTAGAVTYNITDNTFNGYANSDGGYSSSGLGVVGNLAIKDFFTALDDTLPATGGLATMTPEQDLAIITGNDFVNCKNDYTRSDYTSYIDASSPYILAKSISFGENLGLEYALASSKFYVNGDITRTSAATIKAGSELIVLEDASLTIESGATLTNNGTLIVKGTLTNNGTINGAIEWHATSTVELKAALTAARDGDIIVIDGNIGGDDVSKAINTDETGYHNFSVAKAVTITQTTPHQYKIYGSFTIGKNTSDYKVDGAKFIGLTIETPTLPYSPTATLNFKSLLYAIGGLADEVTITDCDIRVSEKRAEGTLGKNPANGESPFVYRGISLVPTATVATNITYSITGTTVTGSSHFLSTYPDKNNENTISGLNGISGIMITASGYANEKNNWVDRYPGVINPNNTKLGLVSTAEAQLLYGEISADNSFANVGTQIAVRCADPASWIVSAS